MYLKIVNTELTKEGKNKTKKKKIQRFLKEWLKDPQNLSRTRKKKKAEKSKEFIV